LDCWERQHRESGRDWVGLILTDAPAGPVRWAAWITTSRGTERATLVLPKEN
jgi:hypothetical protein